MTFHFHVASGDSTEHKHGPDKALGGSPDHGHQYGIQTLQAINSSACCNLMLLNRKVEMMTEEGMWPQA